MTKKETETWAAVQQVQRHSNCRDTLRPGMPRDELVALAPVSCKMPQFLCPAVAAYLRAIPVSEEDE